MNLEMFLKYVLDPVGGAVVVNFLMSQIATLVLLSPQWRRVVGSGLCILVPVGALILELVLGIISKVTPDVIFQVLASAYIIAQTLQLVVLNPVTRAAKTSIKGWVSLW